MRRLALSVTGLVFLCLIALPAYAQSGATASSGGTYWFAVAMAIAAAGCGIAQSRAVAGGCEGVSRNPGAVDTIRFFIILGLAFIEFLALLTFVVILLFR